MYIAVQVLKVSRDHCLYEKITISCEINLNSSVVYFLGAYILAIVSWINL